MRNFVFKVYTYVEETEELLESIETEIELEGVSAYTEPMKVGKSKAYAIHGNLSDVQIHVSKDRENWSVQDIIKDSGEGTYILEQGDNEYVRILVISGEGKIHYTIE